MEMKVKSFEEIEKTLNNSTYAFVDIIGFVRSFYIMDEFWDGKNELKFRRSGKTLATFYINDGYFTLLIIYGKNECEKFEMRKNEFSEFISDYYNNSNTYHDGKWMFIDIHDSTHVQEIINMIKLKKNPNRKEDLSNVFIGKCGYRCDKCLLYVKNNETSGGRFEFQEGDWKCYHTGDISNQADYSNHICGGCRSDCSVEKCVSEKGFQNCGECENNHTRNMQACSCTNPGRCNLGLTADDIERFVYPYCGRERFEKMKQLSLR